MGLDMYLNRKVYIGGEYKHRNVTGEVSLKIGDNEVNFEGKEVSEIVSRVAYWRKANAIHGWFVRECQEGKDECEETYVPIQKLVELRELAKKVLETKDTTPLPPVQGFFFGSDEIDEWYWEDLKDTVKKLEGIEDLEGEFYYRSSW